MKDPILIQEVIKLIIALIFGAIIGAEREYKSKAAGFRTVILITVGSTLFTIVSNHMGADARVASNIVTGIGFLGAGAIFREGVNVKGLTTATTIWISAAIGMSIGIGQFLFALASLVIVMLVLLSFTWIQKIIERSNKVENYHITIDDNKITNKDELKEIFRTCNVRWKCMKQMKNHNQQIFVYSIQGPAKNHAKLIDMLFDAEFIACFES